MHTLNIPSSTLRELANPAPPGQRHRQMVKIAFPLCALGLSPTEVYGYLRPSYGSDVPDSEIEGIVDWAFRQQPLREGGKGVGWVGGGGRKRREIGSKPRDLTPPEVRVQAILKGFRCSEADLWEASPLRLAGDWRQDGSTLIAALYHGSELVNVVSAFSIQGGKARPTGQGMTLPASEWASRLMMGLETCGLGGAWIRMNPVDGAGIADCNVTSYRFALLECDGLPLKLQVSLVAAIPLPISAILTSGGRSLHAWVRLACGDQDEYRSATSEMFGVLGAYGFDTDNKNSSRLSRMPGVERKIGAVSDSRQRLLYLNPNAGSPTPIFIP